MLFDASITSRRLLELKTPQAFANDLTQPQSLAVTDSVNEFKGDSGPKDWNRLWVCVLVAKSRMKLIFTFSIILVHLCEDMGQNRVSIWLDYHFCKKKGLVNNVEYVMGNDVGGIKFCNTRIHLHCSAFLKEKCLESINNHLLWLKWRMGWNVNNPLYGKVKQEQLRWFLKRGGQSTSSFRSDSVESRL